MINHITFHLDFGGHNLSKAFNCVSHGLIIRKLEWYDVSDYCIAIIYLFMESPHYITLILKSDFYYRKECVDFGGKTSSLRMVDSRVRVSYLHHCRISLAIS